MIHFGHFETEIFLRHISHDLTIRNLCDEGNTPGFRPHPSREQEEQYAFPGAKDLIHEDLKALSKPKGHFPSPSQWLSDLHAEVVLCFFGFNSSFDGPAQVGRFKKELDAYLKHLNSMPFGVSTPQVALLSPTAVEAIQRITDGKRQNRNLSLYVEAMKQTAQANKVLFVDCFTPSQKWYEDGKRHSVDGALYNDYGYRKLANFSAIQFSQPPSRRIQSPSVHKAVMDKNYFWLNDYKIPNGVHVYGRRYNPYGPQNYPFEIEKTREYTVNRDRAIWATCKENLSTLKPMPKLPIFPGSHQLPAPSKNSKNGLVEYTPGPQAQTKIEVAEGYKIELFADEKTFPDLANPVQLSFDNKGRLGWQPWPVIRITGSEILFPKIS